MGDAKDAGVFVLLFPGILFPLIFLFKWLVAKVGFKNSLGIPRWKIAIASLLESLAPPLSLFTLPFGPPNFMERRWFRIGSFLVVLFAIDCVANYLVLKMGKRSSTHSVNLGIIILFAAISAALFPASWIALAQVLMKFG